MFQSNAEKIVQEAEVQRQPRGRYHDNTNTDANGGVLEPWRAGSVAGTRCINTHTYIYIYKRFEYIDIYIYIHI